MKLHAFLYMGGYAFYVWTSYGVAMFLLVGNVVRSISRHKRLRADIARAARRRAQ